MDERFWPSWGGFSQESILRRIPYVSRKHCFWHLHSSLTTENAAMRASYHFMVSPANCNRTLETLLFCVSAIDTQLMWPNYVRLSLSSQLIFNIFFNILHPNSQSPVYIQPGWAMSACCEIHCATHLILDTSVAELLHWLVGMILPHQSPRNSTVTVLV